MLIFLKRNVCFVNFEDTKIPQLINLESVLWDINSGGRAHPSGSIKLGCRKKSIAFLGTLQSADSVQLVSVREIRTKF